MRNIDWKKAGIGFLILLLFLSIQVPVLAADCNTTVKIPVEQRFDSKNAEVSEEFTYVLTTDQTDAPMPAGSDKNRQYTWKMNGSTTTDLIIKVETTGQYQYKVYQTTEEKDNFEYDERSYDITVEAFYDADNQLRVVTVVENPDGEKMAGISFQNSDTWQEEENTSKSNGVKTGDHSPVMGYVTLLLGSMICLGVLIRENQRKKKGDAQNEA